MFSLVRNDIYLWQQLLSISEINLSVTTHCYFDLYFVKTFFLPLLVRRHDLLVWEARDTTKHDYLTDCFIFMQPAPALIGDTWPSIVFHLWGTKSFLTQFQKYQIFFSSKESKWLLFQLAVFSHFLFRKLFLGKL